MQRYIWTNTGMANVDQYPFRPSITREWVRAEDHDAEVKRLKTEHKKEKRELAERYYYMALDDMDDCNRAEGRADRLADMVDAIADSEQAIWDQLFEIFTAPCAAHSGENCPPRDEFLLPTGKYHKRCLMCEVDGHKKAKARVKELAAELARYDKGWEKSEDIMLFNGTPIEPLSPEVHFLCRSPAQQRRGIMKHTDSLRKMANFFENEDYVKTHFPSNLIVPLAGGLRSAADEIELLEAELAAYKAAVEKHNKRMAQIPTRKPPHSPSDAMRLLADWFDAVYQDAGENDEVQQDLRRWAVEIEKMQAELAAERGAKARRREKVNNILNKWSERMRSSAESTIPCALLKELEAAIGGGDDAK